MLPDQLWKSLVNVQQADQANTGWQQASLIVNPGARDTVVDPRAFLGHPPREVEVFRAGGGFPTVAGEQVPQPRGKEVTVCVESGDLRPIEAQRGIVDKPPLFVCQANGRSWGIHLFL